MSSIGDGRAALPGDERGERQRRDGERGEHEARRSSRATAPRSGPTRARSARRRRARSRAGRAAARTRRGSRARGSARRSARATTIGRLTRKIQLQSACSISQPPVTGPIAMPMPETPAQIPIALPRSWAGNVAVRIESVDGMMNAPPMPISAAHRDQQLGRAGERGAERAEAEDEQAERQRALAAEAVAERAGGQQHAGEHEHVDVDDPLQLRGGRVEIALERGQRDVEDRVVEPDHEQRQAQDGERPPAAGVERFARNETVPFHNVRRYTREIQKRKRLVSKLSRTLNEALGKRLATFESRLSARLRKRSKMVLVLTAVVDTLPTLLAMAAAALFAVMAWAGGSTH